MWSTIQEKYIDAPRIEERENPAPDAQPVKAGKLKGARAAAPQAVQSQGLAAAGADASKSHGSEKGTS